jgi:hypothetical protein
MLALDLVLVEIVVGATYVTVLLNDIYCGESGGTMEKLQSWYLKCLSAWFIVILFCFAGWSRFLDDFALLLSLLLRPDYAAEITKRVGDIVRIGTFGTAFAGGEWVIRHYLWRMPGNIPLISQSERNLHGRWYGETLYEKVEQPHPIVQNTVPFRKEHEVNISQNCFEIRIGNTGGDGFSSWKSITATIDSDDIFRFLYTVIYSDREKFPKDVHGYEWLSPYCHSDGEKGVPTILLGGFGHVVDGNPPAYSGQTLFIRKGYGKKLSRDDLPEPFRNGQLAERLERKKLR